MCSPYQHLNTYKDYLPCSLDGERIWLLLLLLLLLLLIRNPLHDFSINLFKKYLKPQITKRFVASHADFLR